MPTEAPLSFEPPARHLDDVWDLVWPVPPPPNWRHSLTFYKVFSDIYCLGCRDHGALFLGPPNPGGWVPSPKHPNWPFWGGCGPPCPISALGSNVVAAYSGQTHMQTFTLTIKQALKTRIFQSMINTISLTEERPKCTLGIWLME